MMKTLAHGILVLMAGTIMAAEPIGSVVSMTGKATGRQPGQQSRDLALKSEVYLSDSIETASASRLELMFKDNSVIAVGENSAMTIDEYVYAPANKKKNSFTAKYKEGVFRAVSGNIAKLNPDRFKVKTRMATIGIRGSDVGSDLRKGEIHFCIQSHHPRGLVIIPHQGPRNGQHLAFLPGMQARIYPPGARRRRGVWSVLGFGGRRSVIIARINREALADFLGALRMFDAGGPPVFIPHRQVSADPERLRPPLIPLIPVVPVPPAPQDDGDETAVISDTLLASGTDWKLFKQVDPILYYFTGNALGSTDVAALRAGTIQNLTGSGPFFMTVNHFAGNVDMSGTIDFVVDLGTGSPDSWSCQISASAGSDTFDLTTGTGAGSYDAATGNLLFSGTPVLFTLDVNGSFYDYMSINSGSLDGRLYGPGGAGPPPPTGAGVNLNYTLTDGTTLNGAGAADL